MSRSSDRYTSVRQAWTYILQIGRYDFWAALKLAFKLGGMRVARFRRNGEPDALYQQLCHATLEGDLLAMQACLAQGALAENTDNSALRIAVGLNNLAAVNLLLAAGADPEGYYGEALKQAVAHENAEIVAALLDKGASLDPLADFAGIPENIQQLLFSRADLGTRNCADYAWQGASAKSLYLLLHRQGLDEIATVLRASQALEHLPPIERSRLLEAMGPDAWRSAGR